MKLQHAKNANPIPWHKISTNQPIKSQPLILGLSNYRAQSMWFSLEVFFFKKKEMSKRCS